MTDIIIIALLVLIVGAAGLYIYRAKKSGRACIGCPNSKQCGSSKCSCGCSDDEASGQ